MNPVDILNQLGKHHGYRVTGFTAEPNQKMVWTLEQKDFDKANKAMRTERFARALLATRARNYGKAVGQ